MGIDLRLMPLLTPGLWVSQEHIDLERRSELWPEIEALAAWDIPVSLSCFMAKDRHGECCYGERATDQYGEHLQWTMAGNLVPLHAHEGVQDNWRNRAAWAYLAHMPVNYPVVLYWK